MVFRIVCGLMALLFVVSAAVQYNDPDPIPWMLIYGAAAVLSALGAWRADRPHAGASALVAAVAAAWALSILPGLGPVTFAQILGDYVMKTQAVEEARESIGLGLVAVWCAILAFARLRRRAR